MVDWEEVVLMFDGEAEVTAGDERMRLAAGGIALVPATVPHDLRDAGQAWSASGSSPAPP
jgi:mannose-6-phosphate isomerase-like protein (cupin superfamily)